MPMLLKCSWRGCNQSFSRKWMLKRHTRSVHENVREFVCTVRKCEASFNQASDLKRHNLSVHLNERKFVCTVSECNASYHNSYALKRHNLTQHIKERNFVCAVCNHAFYEASHLQRHKLTVHLKQRNHKCIICTKTFSTSGHLHRHEKFIHGVLTKNTEKIIVVEKPSFTCAYCQHQSSRKDTLLRHITTKHYNNKCFECNDCGHKFGEKSNLKRHILSRHVKRNSITNPLLSLRKAHEKAVTKGVVAIQKTDDGWLVPSFQVPKDGCIEMYVVRKIRDFCPAEDDVDIGTCNLVCMKCNECAHKYSCTCIENDIHTNMCKHIHAVLISLKEMENNNVPMNDCFEEIDVNESMHDYIEEIELDEPTLDNFEEIDVNEPVYDNFEETVATVHNERSTFFSTMQCVDIL